MFFVEMALLLLVTVLVGNALHRIHQPVIIGYILAGIIAGPQLLEWLNFSHELEIFSQIGIMFLLFIVGLHLNPAILREVGVPAVITGLGQIIFTSLFGFFISLALGFSVVSSVFIAIALTFSSTIIIMKLVSDKQDINKLYAKISIGFLLVQDLAASIILVFIPLFANKEGSQSLGQELLKVFGMSGVAILGVVLFAKYLLPRALKNVASSMELLFLMAIAWGVGVAALFSQIGLSLEVGALLAGILLSTSDYAEEMASRLRPLRDFFLVIFFLLLGSQLQFGEMLSVLPQAILFSIFVLIGNPLIVYTLMQMIGYTKKVSFQAGLTVAQISEFSLIVIALASKWYGLPSSVTAVVTLVGIVTISASTYMILYSDKLFEILEPILAKIKIPVLRKSEQSLEKILKKSKNKRIIWFGINPIHDRLPELFKNKKIEAIFIDYDPEVISKAQEVGCKTHFGDAGDVEFLSELDWENIDSVVSLIPDDSVSKLIVQYATKNNSKSKKMRVVVTARTKISADILYEAGAHHVVLPYHLSSFHIEKLME